MSTSINATEPAPPPVSELPSRNEAAAVAGAGQPPAATVPQMQRLAFDVQETADILGISTKSVRRLITRGILRPSRALRHILIAKKEIERFLEQTTTGR